MKPKPAETPGSFTPKGMARADRQTARDLKATAAATDAAACPWFASLTAVRAALAGKDGVVLASPGLGRVTLTTPITLSKPH
jgi:hypothetical protein